MNKNSSYGSEALEVVMEAVEQHEHGSAETTLEEGNQVETVCPPSSPTQKRELDMPTFGLMYSTTLTNHWICIIF